MGGQARRQSRHASSGATARQKCWTTCCHRWPGCPPPAPPRTLRGSIQGSKAVHRSSTAHRPCRPAVGEHNGCGLEQGASQVERFLKAASSRSGNLQRREPTWLGNLTWLGGPPAPLLLHKVFCIGPLRRVLEPAALLHHRLELLLQPRRREVGVAQYKADGLRQPPLPWASCATKPCRLHAPWYGVAGTQRHEQRRFAPEQAGLGKCC